MLRQAERRNIGAHQPAGRAPFFEDGDFVAERHEIARDRQRGRPGADAGDAFAVLEAGSFGQESADVVAIIGGDALQTADGDRFSFDPPAATRRFAGSVADAPEYAGEDVGLTIDQIGVRESTLRDQPDVFRNIGMGRAGPLAIDDTMKIVRISSIGWFHRYLAPYTTTAPNRCRRG